MLLQHNATSLSATLSADLRLASGRVSYRKYLLTAERQNEMSQNYQQQENFTAEIVSDETGVGSYGTKWMHFMETQHPKLVSEMQRKGIYLKVAQSVDDTAWDYRELLDNQYQQLHPRPKTFEEIVSWETTRAFYTDGAVMREKVLIPFTAA
jgi:hypothetical protein